MLFRSVSQSRYKQGEAEVIELVHSRAHTAPLARIRMHDGKGKTIMFYTPAIEGTHIGQKISFNQGQRKLGDIVKVGALEPGDKISNIEITPGDGGKMMRSAGAVAVVVRKTRNHVIIRTPSKREVELHQDCLSQMGITAGAGRLEKPVMKAGKMFHIKKTRRHSKGRSIRTRRQDKQHRSGQGASVGGHRSG